MATILMLGALHARRLYEDKKVNVTHLVDIGEVLYTELGISSSH